MTREEEQRATLFGAVMALCQKIGMTEKETQQMFHPANIKGGYAILNERGGAV